MASTVASLITIVRRHLNETTADFWSDAELASLMNLGKNDLYRAINDNFQHYFVTVDTTNVTHVSGGLTLTGVPSDVGIIRSIEPSDLTLRPGLNYEFRDYNSIEFQRARAQSTQDPSFGLTVYYCPMGAGGPVSAPTIRVAPALSATIALRVTYVPTLAVMGASDSNPIPGESDNALIAWTVAYARAKQTEDGAPDAGWLTLYGTEKTNLLVSLTPRATDDDTVAEAFFEDYWQ